MRPVQIDGKPVMRHAHRPSGRVVEEPLEHFVARAERMVRWRVNGFHLAQIAPRPGS